MLRSWLVALLPVLGLSGAGFYRARAASGARDFTVTGIVRIRPELRARAEKPNSVLFVVAKNRGGIPVAVQRIINPRFPQSFELSRRDLVFPGAAVREPVRLEAALSAGGRAGVPSPGDLEGRYPVGVEPGAGPVPILMDRVVSPASGA